MTTNARRLCLLGLTAVLLLAAASLLLFPQHGEANLPQPQCQYGDRSEVWYFSTAARTTLVGKFVNICAGGTRMTGTTSSYPTFLNCVCPPI